MYLASSGGTFILWTIVCVDVHRPSPRTVEHRSHTRAMAKKIGALRVLELAFVHHVADCPTDLALFIDEDFSLKGRTASCLSVRV